MIEQEYKRLLDGDEYAALLDAFPWEAAVPQVNHYYADGAGELARRGVTLRVRERAGRFVLQTKAPVREEGALHVGVERECPVDGAPPVIAGEVLRALVDGDIGDAACVGALTTLRRVYRPAEGVELCLDENRYRGRVDFELELEYTGEPPRALLDALAARGILFAGAAKGKYARFLDAIQTGEGE